MLTILLLCISNIFMTVAWYGHLKHRSAPIFEAIVGFAWFYLGERIRWNYTVSFVCLMAAVVFAFWGRR